MRALAIPAKAAKISDEDAEDSEPPQYIHKYFSVFGLNGG